MNSKSKKTRPTGLRTAAGTVACLLVAAILALSLSSCDLLGRGGDSDGTVTTTTAMTRPDTTLDITVNQYYTPAPVPDDAGTYAYVAREASPSVVSITTEAISYDKYYGSYVQSGAGSGVIFSADDTYTYIITNNHVIEGASSIKVFTNTEGCPGYSADVMGTDWMTDIAVVRIKKIGLTIAEMGNSRDLKLGQEVAAIGNPLGTLGGTVTDGIVSCLAREISVDGVTMTLIQHSAGVSPGNSGGGLFNLYGQLIGIVNAKSSGTGVEDIGFAIPVDIAVDRALQLTNKGYVSGTPYLGMSFAQSSNYGLVVSGYAYNAELSSTNQDTIEAGHILNSLNGVTITEIADIRTVLCNAKEGDVLTAVMLKPTGSFYGGYSRYTVSIKVHEYEPTGASTPDEPSSGETDGDINFN